MEFSEIKKSLLLLAGATLMFACTSDPANPDEGKDDNSGTTTPEEPKELVLTTFAPTEGKAGAQVTLSGENFGTAKSDLTVTFGEVKVPENSILNVKDDAIIVLVPNLGSEAEPVEITVKVGNGEAQTYEAMFNFQVEEIQYETIWKVETFAGSGYTNKAGEAPKDGPALEATFRRIADIIYDKIDNALITVSQTDQPLALRKIVNGQVSTLVANLKNQKINNPTSLVFSKNSDTLFVSSDNNADFLVGYLLRTENFANVYEYIHLEDTQARTIQHLAIHPTSGTMVFSTFDGPVYVVENGADGKVTRQIGTTKDIANQNNQGSVIFSPDGKNLYFSLSGYSGILKADWNSADNSFSNLRTFVGSSKGDSDGLGTAAQFRNPSQLCFAPDESGDMYVTDCDNNRIRRITAEGMVSTFSGSTEGNMNGEVKSAKFCRPRSICVGENDCLYIGEYRGTNLSGPNDIGDGNGNHIRVIKPEQVPVEPAN